MSKHIAVVVFAAFICLGQDMRTVQVVKGAVASTETLIDNHLSVSLTDALGHKIIARTFVAGDGSFEFHDVPAGTYSVELLAQNGDFLSRETLNLNSAGDRIEIRMPEREQHKGPGETVSARQLLHPISKKSQKLFGQAQKLSAAGEYSKAIEALRSTLNDEGAVAFAHMNIGVAYVRAGQAETAIPELQEAVRLMPEDALAHTNLAYALMLTRRMDAAEAEARKSLAIDRNSFKTRWILGSILLAKGSQVEEAVDDLHFASREIPKARITLVQFYARRGQKEAAARELRAYLPQAAPEDRAMVEQWLLKLVQ